MDITAASFSCVSSSSSDNISEKSRLTALTLLPIIFTTLAYCILSVTILVSSGKCQPYHSRTLMA
uniref:Uncharacterized protein n=1 Tax=Zea mays TaxID=4577 RepID=C0PNR6_MAIZE|nr:unknown [Zea mays]